VDSRWSDTIVGVVVYFSELVSYQTNTGRFAFISAKSLENWRVQELIMHMGQIILKLVSYAYIY
jgi:hypothetical protein